ncbi:hypothetical protein [Nitrobacter sp. TKz-YC02]|uniref:hypothetical protein n=1 Tax=Nitrobacter sp. TKz-YC02 TaxID=3398704 RepID=UPI003CEFD8B5
MDYLLRPTVIAGDKLKDDYCVFQKDRCIGRIRLADERSWQGVVWQWHVTPLLPIPSWCNGNAASLDEAKGEFKEAWERFSASLTPEQIEGWHRAEDIAKTNASWLR